MRSGNLLRLTDEWMDGRTDQPTDRPTNGRTDGPSDGRMDTPAYRDARMHLKIIDALA